MNKDPKRRTVRYNGACINLPKGRLYIATYAIEDEIFKFCRITVHLVGKGGKILKSVYTDGGYLEDEAIAVVTKFNKATEDGSKEW